MGGRRTPTYRQYIDSETPPPELLHLGLTPRQWRFAQAYCRDPTNQGAAAIAAGYAPARAYATGSRLVRYGKIRAAIAAIQADNAKASRLTPEYVAARILWGVSQQPGAEEGPSWRDWVSLAVLAARVTGLIQPGERTTNVLSVHTALDGMSVQQLRAIADGMSSAPVVDVESTQAADSTRDVDN